jgi:hypothetical protein
MRASRIIASGKLLSALGGVRKTPSYETFICREEQYKLAMDARAIGMGEKVEPSPPAKLSRAQTDKAGSKKPQKASGAEEEGDDNDNEDALAAEAAVPAVTASADVPFLSTGNLPMRITAEFEIDPLVGSYDQSYVECISCKKSLKLGTRGIFVWRVHVTNRVHNRHPYVSTW